MQPSEHTALRRGLVVLHKDILNPRCLEIVIVINLEKIPPLVSEHLWRDHFQTFYMTRFNRNLAHLSSRDF